MTTAVEPTSSDTAAAVLDWARLCGWLVSRQWNVAVCITPATLAHVVPAGRWRLAVGDREAAAVLADERLLRALSHAVHEAMSLPLGAGRLTDVEQGLIDYFSVKLLHALSRLTHATTPALAGVDFDDVAPSPSAAAFEFVVAVGGIEGRLRVELPAATAGPVLPPAFSIDATGDVSTRAFIVLAGFALDDGEWQHLEPGDAVTLAASAMLGRPVDVRADTGWRVARGVVATDTPTLLTVEVTDADVSPVNTPADEVTVRLAQSVRVAAGVPPTAGRRIDFARSAGDVLVTRGRDGWRGEIVRVDGELAVRLLGRTEGESA